MTLAGNMCYFTITSDIQNKDGHTQAIMIINADNEEYAKREYIKTFNLPVFDISEGIHIADGFADLVTAPIKKLITKYKSGNSSGNSDVSLVSYCNSVHTKYPEE
jgi:hypothetical protein